MSVDAQQRKDKIFEIIVQAYIDTAEPVGSRAISRRADLGLSSASIRNVMADLEEQGFLKQPHTSAGRVPTDKGYRYYVDCLMKREELTEEERDWIESELDKARTVEAMTEKISNIISTLTQNAALIYLKSLKRISFLNHLLEELIAAQKIGEFLEEEPELFIEGMFRIFEQPEFHDSEKMGHLLKAFDEKRGFLEILLKDLAKDGLHVHIGSENAVIDLDSVSLVVKDCHFGNIAIGGVAAIGPTRMKYAKVVSVVDFVADSVSKKVKKF